MASNALITSKNDCPLCNSSVRREIDAIVTLTRPQVTTEPDGDGNFDILPARLDLDRAFLQVEKLLKELPNDTAPYDEADFFLHATQHPLVTTLSGFDVHREGKMLYVGEQVFPVPDLQAVLQALVLVGLEHFIANPQKITTSFMGKAIELLWRMNAGLAGQDEFLQTLQQVIKSKGVPADSPLAQAYAERQRAMEEQKKQQSEERPPDEGAA